MPACKRVAVAPRIALVRQAVAALRARYPELRRGVTLELLERVVGAEGIRIHRVAMPPNQLGRALEFCGARGILLEQSLAGDAALQVLAHELGHCELHVCDRALAEARAASIRAGCWALDEVVEEEAEAFAAALISSERRSTHLTPLTNRVADHSTS